MPEYKKTTENARSLTGTRLTRWLGSRTAQYCAAIAGAVLVVLAVTLGERFATRAIQHHEHTIGDDLAASIDRILSGASTRDRANIAELASLPCTKIGPQLAELETHLRYVRAVALTRNGRVYCSSALGPIDAPLSAFLAPQGDVQRISLLAETPFQRGIPVLVIFRPANRDAGVLYVIEGDYLADVLAHGVRYGAKRAVLEVAGNGALDEQGHFHTGSIINSVDFTTVKSRAWPFVVRVTSSAGFAARTRWGYALAFGAFGTLAVGLVAVAYLLAFAPRRLLLGAIRKGLRRGEFHLVYQPVVAIADGTVVAAEALLRWHHGKWGPVSPAAYMDDVEASDMLGEVTRFVLRTVSADMNAHPSAGPLRVAVNIAPRDLERREFVEEVIATVKCLPRNVSLVLELTERFLLSKNARTHANFTALKSDGVKFAIDDFGTEHSNLDLLGRFPFDYVKIDRQFVTQLDAGGDDLISGVVALARHFGLTVIAEGVETQAQHDGLMAAGVPYAQGYLYQRPVAPQTLAALVRPPARQANP